MKIKTQKAHVVQIREKVKPFIERAQLRYYEEHDEVISTTTLLTRILMKHFEDEERKLGLTPNDIANAFEASAAKSMITNRKKQTVERVESGEFKFKPTQIKVFTLWRPNLKSAQIAAIIGKSDTIPRTAIREVVHMLGFKRPDKKIITTEETLKAQKKMVELGVIPADVLQETQPLDKIVEAEATES